VSAPVVLDASAAVELLVLSAVGRRLAHRLADPDVEIHAPHLMAVEVTQVLRREVAAGRMTSARGRAAVDDLVDLGVQRHDHEVLLPRVWQLRDNVTAYDAVYLALAEALDAPLLTLDARLGRAAGHQAAVEVLGASEGGGIYPVSG
jgi:predicted nucleic acid-binding protein